jgi:hypothetical protein
MSVAAISKVWERSRAKGSELLVLLAIADYADDDGRDAWPSVQKLADKSRMTERGVREVLKRLVADDELAIDKNTDGREVKGGYRPRHFMHIRCCDAAAKIADAPEKISDRTTEKIVDPPAEFSGESEKISGPNVRDTAPKRERDCSALKEDPSGIRQYTRTRASDGRRTHPLDDPQPISPESVEQFKRFWAVYPRKEGEIPANRAWVELAPDPALAEQIIAAVIQRNRLGWAEEGRFVLQATRFLEERRWLEPYTPRPRHGAERPEQSVEGWKTARACPGCGAEQSGVYRNGRAEFPTCSQCGRRDALRLAR